MRRFNLILAALALLIGAPWYWLLIDNRPGDAAAKPVTIAQLRQLAASLPGPPPSAVEMESPAYRRLPGTLFAAGIGVRRVQIGIMAFRLPVPGGQPVMIDSGLHPAEARAMDMEYYDPGVQGRIDAELRTAGLILITHEHSDHQGALVRLGGKPLHEQARLNPAQLPPAPLAAKLAWGATPPPPARIGSAAPQALAAGVVVIPAPSHTPGSQMIFVRLGNGQEFLFTGDIATLRRSWSEIRARSRLIGSHYAPEDRSEVYVWLKTIKALKHAAPGLVVVPGHDLAWAKYSREANSIHRGFTAQ